jgi:hypothetical protein
MNQDITFKPQVFVLTFQTNERERDVICDSTNVDELVAFHKRKGHLVSVCPIEIVNSKEYV